MINISLAILIAYFIPQMEDYLAPHITSSYVAVILICFISGLNLKTT
jgi:predicted Na+-dependent transporter